jgi:hypothetical protein
MMKVNIHTIRCWNYVQKADLQQHLFGKHIINSRRFFLPFSVLLKAKITMQTKKEDLARLFGIRTFLCVAVDANEIIQLIAATLARKIFHRSLGG